MTDKNILQRYEERRKRIAEERMLEEEAAKKRAYAAARQIVRKKAEEKAGGSYEQLGPTQRETVDKAVADKELVKKVALRLLPKYKTGDRSKSFTHGQPLDNLGQAEGDEHPVQTFKGNVKEANDAVQNFINDKFSQNFKKGEDSANTKGGKREKGSTVVQFAKFGEQMYDALERKAEKTGIDISILGEVFVRGLDAHEEANTRLTREQYAFARVNSYISKGKTYYTEDADLHEEKEEDLKPVSNIEKIAKKHGISVDEMKARLKEGIKVEREHTKETNVAATIALKHLSEKPDYYSKLKKYVEEVELDEMSDEEKARRLAIIKYYAKKKETTKVPEGRAKGVLPKGQNQFASKTIGKSNPRMGKGGSSGALANTRARKAVIGEESIEEGRAPGRAYVKNYLHPQTGEKIGYKSSTKWGRVRYWRDTESALAKAKAHAGVDKLDEEIEKLDELSKTTLGSYVKKASKQASTARGYEVHARRDQQKDMANQEMKLRMKREKGIDTAVNKLTKEEADLDEETGSSYREELPQILKDIRGKRKSHSDMRREYGSNWKRLTNATSAEHGSDYNRSHLLSVGQKHLEEATIKSNKDGQTGGRGQTFSSYAPSSYKVVNDKGEHIATAHNMKDPKYGGRTTHWHVTWHKERHKDHPTSFQFMHQLKKHVKELNEGVELFDENFIDGKGPGKPGDAARHGLKGKSASELKKIRSSETASPRQKQLAHWMLNMHHNEEMELEERGLWDNIHAKRKRIKAGSGERMRKPGSKGAPTAQDFKDASESYVNEEERPDPKVKVEGTNCRNCVSWRKDLEKPVTKEELNPNGGLKAPNEEYIAMSKRVDLGTLPGKDGGVKIKGFCDNDMIKDWVTERMCCAQWDSDGMIRDYKGTSPVMDEETNSEKRMKVTAVARTGEEKLRKHLSRLRDPKATEDGQKLTRNAEIKHKIIDEEGNSQPDASKRLIGTDSLVKAYKTDTPGETPAKPKKAVNESLNESFNIAYAAGIGQTFTAADLGMKMQGAFAHHPDTIKDMEEMEARAMEEDVVSKTKSPVIIPPIRREDGTYTPARTVLRTTGRKIIKGDPNVSDGK